MKTRFFNQLGCQLGSKTPGTVLARKVMAWISSMDARNLRGLVNELSERPAESIPAILKAK
jgi:hypothetical protein